MRILMVHNYYREPGGEDAVFAAEAGLLRAHGQEVVEYTEHNRRIEEMGPLSVAARMIWSRASRRGIHQKLAEVRPVVAHFHNTFALISPAGYYACRKSGVPVVQTLHNYRLLCPAAMLFRAGRACEECLRGGLPWPAIRHACYHASRPQTAAVAAMLWLHGWLRTWEKGIDVFIALNEFCRRKFIEGGLPGEKILIKPHFVSPDPGLREGRGEYALFVGRLSEEKGIRTLLRAWRRLGAVPLVIAGDGPLMGLARSAAGRSSGAELKVLGRCSREEVFRLMKGARFLVFASEWYETFGLVLIEAFACGLPVLAARLGAAEDVVRDGFTGLLFTGGEPDDLAAKADWLWTRPAEGERMGREARKEYEEKYTAERNYGRLMEIYGTALAR
jgi:glycosyltransferase involved in cell wall biosynthesis